MTSEFIKTDQPFRAGDEVVHGPSQEEWVLAVDQHGHHVSWCGWPEGTARASDCELRKRATDQERLNMLKTWADKTGNDHRIGIAQEQLEKCVNSAT